jgi:hypothetical protein
MQSTLRVHVDATSVEAQRVLAYLALGLVDATTAGALPVEEACASFFVPVFLKLVDCQLLEPSLFEALHAASELGDVERLVPQTLQSTMQRIRQNLLVALTNLNRKPVALAGRRLVNVES